MGQRLNVEIKKQGELLANGYYHWSAYSGSACDIGLDILNYIEEHPQGKMEDVLYAIRVLESTGAGLPDRELEEAKKLFRNSTFQKFIDRNEGIISITKKGMQDTKDWEEGCITIYLDDNTVDFDVWYCTDIDEYKDYSEKEPVIRETNINLWGINYNQLCELRNIITDYEDGEFNLLRLPDGNTIQFIY